ncbi:MAG: GGDEF domain-containing protein, partial [Deltaproteobacteria bacterium]|nr:GGDEF domain-containing protein [Deltaproteobacteria bacterium]
RYFFGRLETEFARAKRYNYPLSIVIMDIDDFKGINDRLGHQQGDTVLKGLSQILREQTRTTDLWARYGGEEFIGYLPHCGKDEAYKLAERIRKIVEGYSFSGMDEGTLTISLGVAYYPHPEVETLDDLVGIADGLLYTAKGTGKNRVMVG